MHFAALADEKKNDDIHEAPHDDQERSTQELD